MNYVTLWLTAYINPVRFADELRTKPAPQWGFGAALQRGLMDSLLTYLPVYLLGRIPPAPSNLSFIPTESYYGALIFLAPIASAVFGFKFLFSASRKYLGSTQCICVVRVSDLLFA